MCLIKGKDDFLCLHQTCIESKDEPNFWYNTKSAMFLKKNDFNKIYVFTVADGSLSYLQPINPHKTGSGTWESFEVFKQACKFQIAGHWPAGKVFSKFDINFEYFLFGRRIPVYDPLTETYSSEIILDVEEAAVFKNSELEPNNT